MRSFVEAPPPTILWRPSAPGPSSFLTPPGMVQGALVPAPAGEGNSNRYAVASTSWDRFHRPFQERHQQLQAGAAVLLNFLHD